MILLNVAADILNDLRPCELMLGVVFVENFYGEGRSGDVLELFNVKSFHGSQVGIDGLELRRLGHDWLVIGLLGLRLE